MSGRTLTHIASAGCGGRGGRACHAGLGVALITSVVVTALIAPGAGAHEGSRPPPATLPRSGHAHGRAGAGARRPHARRHRDRLRGQPRRPSPRRLRTWASGVRSSTGRSWACTSRCCRTARSSPTTRSATTRPRRTRAGPHTRDRVGSATGIQTPVNVDTGFNIFCSGLAHLLDGRMFIAGGNKDAAAQRHRPDSPVRSRDEPRGASARTWRPGAGIRP